ncbi:beta-lactamase-like protein [Kockovaella imperatae]|uniref:Beta-lactamase-like protein n=1 Tax=Kockovaella imperatae TaxID=4999 RepID=A0A1Y1UKS5_9TREE|nr:beta-lactamase-like protein [Kockovaella imperatae]ORX38076.1 beta-lactamase-like protein [Kockovaella imperatae]
MTSKHLLLDPSDTRPASTRQTSPTTRFRPSGGLVDHDSEQHAVLTFIGTATTLLQYGPLTILTDPNFLHAGDHVHLGPGVTATRTTKPSMDLDHLPHIDLVLLSHYHEDHFDKQVEDALRRDIPIITTPHAKSCLVDNRAEVERFSSVLELDTWDTARVNVKDNDMHVEITAAPGKHVPPGALEKINDMLGAVPPVNGWVIELSSSAATTDLVRIYITGDTLLIDDLVQIPERYSKAGRPIHLMLAHLGGTTIPSPRLPMLMVTMDAKMGVDLIKLVDPDITIPIHFDDYDVFASPLDDFRIEVEKAGLKDRVVFLGRGETYSVRATQRPVSV